MVTEHIKARESSVLRIIFVVYFFDSFVGCFVRVYGICMQICVKKHCQSSFRLLVDHVTNSDRTAKVHR